MIVQLLGLACLGAVVALFAASYGVQRRRRLAERRRESVQLAVRIAENYRTQPLPPAVPVVHRKVDPLAAVAAAGGGLTPLQSANVARLVRTLNSLPRPACKNGRCGCHVPSATPLKPVAGVPVWHRDAHAARQQQKQEPPPDVRPTE
jgi:hypothetical protein